ncbi:MAG TPA: DNA polymerase III subunit delta' [Burkholderiaceae bacterium]|nr:DNA polymerase III subunit delta' [Burkholderiaceae bacterium]
MSDPVLAPWLEAALDRGLVHRAHALLLHGPGPLGQFELAAALARAWLCENPHQGRSCGACAACHLFDQHSHPDFKLLLPEALREPLGWAAPADDEDEAEGGGSKSKAKPSREIRIDEVRAAIDWGQRTSARARAKVLVIHPAEAMNPSAANALLKTLEEPPGALRLLLTAHDPEALLPTVRSRCQRVAIGVPPRTEALDWLRAQGLAEPEVLWAAAGGLPQAALAWHQEGIDAAAWRRVPADVRRGAAKTLAAWPLPRVVDALQRLCHDLLAIAVGGEPRYFEASWLEPLRQPRAPAVDALVTLERELRVAARHDDHPWHAALRVEALLARMAALWHTARVVPAAASRALDTLPGR